ncbi:MAG TPA: protease modulator HflC [Deltaproteobacteria bacterium]|nr:protease modulator HflC [Deltaproteobacteria bacterium]
MKSKLIALSLIGLTILLIFFSVYVVDETEQVVVTQFGRVVGEQKTAAGLQFKVPFIQKANYFPKNLLRWDGEPGEIPTLDKTYLWLDSFARWRIFDPIKFFKTVNNVQTALNRLDDIIDPAVRNFITSHKLIESVRNSNRKLDPYEVGLEGLEYDQRTAYTVSVGRERITHGIVKQAQSKLSPFGIELVDIKIKQINYVEQVRKSVYDRMIAERKQISEKFRSQGRGEAQEILGEKERDLKQILSEAYRTAQEVKGKADAGAARIYADAYGIDPKYFTFYRTLDVYRKSLGNKDTMLVLSTDSEFLKYLKDYRVESEMSEHADQN